MLNPEAPRARYVEIDGAWHEIGEDEHTTSGLVIPPLSTWVEELPEGAKLQTEEPKVTVKFTAKDVKKTTIRRTRIKAK